jgi:DNA polymerase III subunit beta
MITVAKSLLIPVLERCSRVAQQKSSPPNLSHVKIEFADDVLTYSVTNLITSIRGSVAASGKSDRFTVNVRDLLANATSVIGDNAKLSLDDKGKLTVSGEGKRRFTCRTLPADEFPVIALEATEWVDLPSDSLKALISRVMFAVGAERDERQNLKCVRVRVLDSILSAAGANGHALGFASDVVESTATVTAIIPRSCVSSLLALDAETIAMSVSDNSVAFRSGPETMIAQTIADVNSFPPIDVVMEQYSALAIKTAGVSCPAIVDALAAIRRTDSKADIDLTFTKGELKIESGTEDDGGYAVDTVVNSGDDEGEVRLAAEYLTGAIKGCANATIKFGVDLDPFIITDGMFTAILMPLRKQP